MSNFWYSDRVRLLFVADGRSPIALGWIRYFVDRGDEVHLASTFFCAPSLPLQSLEIVPVAYSGGRTRGTSASGASSSGIRWRNTLRHLLGPLTIPRAAKRLRAYAQQVKPELVHAMRIPFEGMLASDAYSEAPLLVSVWGNDFTFHAPSNLMMRHYTTWTMSVTDGLHADCRRDVRLARHWGLDTSKPAIVLPGAGGVSAATFFPPDRPSSAPTIINPRGSRAYVRNDVFFRAIPVVLARHPHARFVAVAQASDRDAVRWVERLGITESVTLLPHLTQSELAERFRQSAITVSPSIHDGTPNSLLEGMACGSFPIAGDLESIREWISDGENGLLVDANDPASLAEAISRALESEDLRAKAADLNRSIIAERADYARCMAQAGEFYGRLVSRRA